jgi:hypothetical protein
MIRPNSKVTLRAENAQSIFQVFHLVVASVSCGCCKSRLGCCLCCNGCTCMLQEFVSNVSAIFPDVCCKCVYLDVAYFSHICCKCFMWMLRMFYMVFKCFTCFIYLQTHVASVASGCFKSRSGVASLSSLFCCLSLVSPPPLGAG